jgi:asparagine synthase (glutamine-hydrolysing)
MSGIVAAYGPFDRSEGLRMLDRLVHRGPDGEGDVQVGDAWLGHRRLDLVPPDDVGQPFHDRATGLWLVGDGEVYNHHRLRAELEEQGEVFRTSSDQETVARLAGTTGPDSLDRLWGIFALVASDGAQFVAGRDLLGIVPLYWVHDDDTVIFASEIKAFDPARRNDVEAFPPGHTWTPADGLQPFRRLPTIRTAAVTEVLGETVTEPEAPETVLGAIRDTLVSAVERAMANNVDQGTLLSGGLDSSIVTAIAARVAQAQGWRLPTFAVGLADSDDLAAARQLATHLGTAHYERIYTEDELIDWVPEVIGIIESFDPQLVHSSVPNLLVSRMAARHVRGVLIGEGADELFAGYAHYRDIDSQEELQEELLRTIEGLHAGGLQRVDRIAAANGLGARAPFLDAEVVELALGLPARWKLVHDDQAEKWLLRKAFEGWIPDNLLWRPKAQFGEGSGAREILRNHYSAQVTEGDLEVARREHPLDPPIRTREELAYYLLFQRHLTGMEPGDVISRFVEA